MNLKSNRYFTLIVDSQKSQSLYIKTDERLQNSSVKFCSSASEAVQHIADPNLSIAAVFLNPLLNSPGPISVIKKLKCFRPATPLFLLQKYQQDFSNLELGRIAASGSIIAPLTRESLDKLISPIIFETEHIFRTLDLSDKNFISVPSTDLLSGCSTRFDIFLRLPSKKYLKISHANETLAIDRVKSYIEKGVSHFYLRKANHEACLNYCDALSELIFMSPEFSVGLKSQETFNLGDRVVQDIRKNGLNELHFDYIYTFLRNLRNMVQAIPVGGDIDSVLEHVGGHEHAVSVAVLSALLCLPLKYSTQSLFEIIALGAFLHDVGLYQLPEALQSENGVTTLTLDQQTLFESHPQRSAEILQKFSFINDTVIQSVSQHHQRRNGSGFPKVKNPNSILQASEIIGLAEEITNQTNFKAKDFAPKVQVAFSEPIYNAYAELFKLN